MKNTNGLIRQYFPKETDFLKVTETDFLKVTDEEIQFVMERINNRPRASRNNLTPSEIFMEQRVDLLAA